MDKTLYLICGPESAGNRLMSRIFIEAGCLGNGDVIQRFDKEDPPQDADKIVLHRSFPYGHRDEHRHWPNVHVINNRFTKLGYKTSLIIMVRDQHCMALSQVKAQHVDTLQEARTNIITAYGLIFSYAVDYNYLVVSYESLVLHPTETIKWILECLNLPIINFTEEIRDENYKWY